MLQISSPGGSELGVSTDFAEHRPYMPGDDVRRVDWRRDLHFQTETTIELPPGEHTLQLLMGDKHHIPHNPPVASPVITVTVK